MLPINLRIIAEYTSLVAKKNLLPNIYAISKANFYDVNSKNDTIFAVATGNYSKYNVNTPLSVIRVSGLKAEHSVSLLTRKFVSRQLDTEGLKDINAIGKLFVEPRVATNVKIHNPRTKDLIDLAIMLWFPAPKSYTGEDVCEFHVHGSQAIVKSILTILGSQHGFRPAEPGEFTKRAVQNKKLSLVEAESLHELISANTQSQLKLALKGLDGTTRKIYETWIDKLVTILAHLEASIDFGEDEMIEAEQAVIDHCRQDIRTIAKEISTHIEVSSRSRAYVSKGFKIVILGKPNSGKSTLMNILCQRDKSIVSDLSGTTRDIVDCEFEFGGFAIKLSDTAGLSDLCSIDQQFNDKEGDKTMLSRHKQVEAEGIKRAVHEASKCDIIMYLIDIDKIRIANDAQQVRQIILDEILENLNLNATSEVFGKKQLFIILNKIDTISGIQDELSSHILASQEFEDIKEEVRKSIGARFDFIEGIEFCELSCKTLDRYDKLSAKLIKCLGELSSLHCSHEDDTFKRKSANGFINNASQVDSRSQSKEHNYIREEAIRDASYINERHLSLLKSVSSLLESVENIGEENLDFVAQQIRDSTDYLSRIVGDISDEQVFDVVFKDFCIGK